MKQVSAMSSPVYRRFFTGSLLSSIGDYVGVTALNWYVLESTSSPFYLGMINFFRLLPALFIGLLGGWLADRFPQRTLLIILYIPILILGAILAWYVAAGQKNMWILSTLVILRGLFDEMEPPVRNALLPDIVPPHGIASGVALYTTMLNVARMIGPALAGIMIARVGVAPLFIFHVFAQLAVFASLFAIPRKSAVPVQEPQASSAGFGAVISFLRSQPRLLFLLILSVCFMLFGFSYSSLVPIYVLQMLQTGPATFGYLLTATAAGAVLGAFALTRIDSKRFLPWTPWFALGFTCSLFVLGFSHYFVLAAIALFLMGLFSQAFRTSIRIVFQLSSPEGLRGRLMSVIMADRGFIPLGVFLASAAAEKVSIASILILMSACCLLCLLGYICLYPRISKEVSSHASNQYS
ncbi:MFS transporter [Paenibacillus sp. SYP-B3998]|uniref:MFS transporter n=1 Tax=Paenibacillus sp. SYP-B3998 TaxID=2678564 RepID=A0A6G3ZSG8_9BACL|nr:MFS transporter [Paenibacillus sp. SYP-B3998]NEW05000.1 MFS transporter [Paenibacillus sp. SYP-B3998]